MFVKIKFSLLKIRKNTFNINPHLLVRGLLNALTQLILLYRSATPNDGPSSSVYTHNTHNNIFKSSLIEHCVYRSITISGGQGPLQRVTLCDTTHTRHVT